MVDKLVQPVPNYERAPCRMQRAWAAHNSMVASVREGKSVVYKAPCDVDPKAVAARLPPQRAPVSLQDETDWHKAGGVMPRRVPEVDPQRARRTG